MLKPKYRGKIEETTQPCYCKGRIGGKVWMWVAPVEGQRMAMAAHTKCFHRLWKGEN